MSKSTERLYSFFETPIFMRQIEQRASMKVLFAIEDDLLKNPERGDVIHEADCVCAQARDKTRTHDYG